MFFRFIVIPMFLFSGAFFPVSFLPRWLEAFAVATPMFHGVELARAIMIGQTPVVTWWVSVLYLTVWIVGFGVIAIAPLRRKLTP
jgi:lipooligosaccharide transport system permease protein